MSKKQITIRLHDEAENDECVVVLTRNDTSIGLCLSSRGNGDVEVYLAVHDAIRIADAISALSL